MSGRPALDTWAVQHGIARRREGASLLPRDARRRPPFGRERRSRSPLAVLSREHDALCLQAGDALEIAAGLEAAGLDDRRARQEYGCADVFELAERLFALVPRRAPVHEAEHPAERRPWVHLVHGSVAALPALAVLAALQAAPTRSDLAVLAAAAVCAAAAGQLLAVLGHVLLAREERAAARRLVRVSLASAAASMAALAVAAPLLGDFRPVPVVAAGQVLAVLAATALLLARVEVLLPLVLAPAAAAGSVALVAPHVLRGQVPGWATAAVGTGLAVAVVAASSSLRGGPRGRPGGAPLAGLLDGGDLRPALAGAAAAASGTGLLSFVVLDVLTGERAPGPLGIAMVPAVLAAVPAGRALHRLRQEGRDALAASTTISEFASRARRALARAVRAQAVAAGGGCAAGALVALLVARDLPAGRLALDLATVGLLAVALFLAGVLVALTRPGLAAAATGAGLAGDLALRALPAGSAAGPARLAAAAVLVAVLFRIAATQVERPFLHR